MRRWASWRVVAVVVVGLALSVAGVGPFGGIDAANAAVIPGTFTARLHCTDAKKLVGTGVVTVTAPDTDATVNNAELWARTGSDPFVEGTKTPDVTTPALDFTYEVLFGSAVPYLGLADLRLVKPDGNPNTNPTDILASVNDVVVRAAQGCDEPEVVVTISAATRACTAPSVLTGTLDITGDNTPALLGTVGLDFYNGATRFPAILASVDADTWSWSVQFGTATLVSPLTYEVTTSVPTIRQIATGTMVIPNCLGVRLFGPDAIDTAIDISQESYGADSASAVVLARSDFFSDALAGGPLAAVKGGPMLITPGASQSPILLPKVLDEIERVLDADDNANDTVYVLGGPLALSTAIDDELVAAGYHVVRIFGANLFATAVAIAGELGNPNTIFEATGLHFADALSAVPAAIKTSGAILLTNGSQQAPETGAYLAAHPGVLRYAIGGPLAAAGADPGAVAIYGQDLFDTAAQVATVFFANPQVIGIATGNDYPDALGGGVFMATGGRSGPMLLVNQNVPLPASIATYVNTRLNVVVAWVFGGPLAVDPAVVNAIVALLTS